MLKFWPFKLYEISSGLYGGIEGEGDGIIGQLVKVFMRFIQLVKLFGGVSQIFINLV